MSADAAVTQTAEARVPDVITDYWLAALKLYADNCTAEELRAMADDPIVTTGLALLSGITPEQHREQDLRLARCIDSYVAKGMTRAGAWDLAGLDREFGPYPGEDALSATGAAA
jgi:hypothetical protein